jgi:hypothetical protein
MSTGVIIGVGLIVIVALVIFLAIYFKSGCKSHDDAGACNTDKNCKWDTYGVPAKCIGKDDSATPNPNVGGSGGSSGGGTPASSPDYVEARYVRMESPNVMRINEILVYDENDNLISHNNDKVTASASSTQENWGPVSKLYNFQIADYPFHTLHGESAWVQIDLGEIRKISKVVIVNQSYAADDMALIDNNDIKLLDADEKVVAEATISVDDIDDGKGKPIFVFLPKSNTIVQPNTIATDKPIRARYVRIDSKNGKFLVLGELEIYGHDGKNIAVGKTASMSTTHHPHWAAPRLVDGDKTTEAHTLASDTGFDWMEVDLGSVYTITGVRIYSRTAHEGAYKSHANRIWVSFYDENKKFIINTTRTNGDKEWYDFKLKNIPTNWTTSAN